LKHNYLEIHQTDFRKMFMFGRTMAVDERCEISFSIPHILLVLVRGVVGRERLVAQPGGLTLGFVLHLVSFTKNPPTAPFEISCPQTDKRQTV